MIFREIARVLEPGGRVAFIEVDRPRPALIRAAHALYFDRVVPLVGGLLSDRSAYAYLPKSTVYLPPTRELLALLEDAGFEQVRTQTIATRCCPDRDRQSGGNRERETQCGYRIRRTSCAGCCCAHR